MDGEGIECGDTFFGEEIWGVGYLGGSQQLGEEGDEAGAQGREVVLQRLVNTSYNTRGGRS